MSAQRTREQRFGDHLMWFEEPDTMALEVHGEVTAVEARGIMAEQREIAAGRRYLFLLVDMSGFTSISAEARRVFAADAGVMPPLVSVYFGASFRARVIGEMLFGIANLIGGRRHRHRVCDSEAAARAYLAESRPSYAGAR